MAAGKLSAPGTEYGPCEGNCKHDDCVLTRAMAERACVVCGKPIGYETGFYRTNIPAEGDMMHSACYGT